MCPLSIPIDENTKEVFAGCAAFVKDLFSFLRRMIQMHAQDKVDLFSARKGAYISVEDEGGSATGN